MPSLWSQADELAGHSRRYSRTGLTSELARAGFEVRSCGYAFGMLVPAVGILRALPYRFGMRRSPDRESAVGTRQVAGYGRMWRRVLAAGFAAERALRRIAKPPIGTCLVAVFVRPL
jgi:hypothetical protein